ncbi:hypothetical protein DWU99_18145 [Dyella psychrodurans]|uniref:Uncharacterized protein n=1 Tax=Dyella psychrodurans TaxID=1927960 RepID=A0A370WXV9_9GAMM|nr:hypothetical protein DWU99_18145 [Dyella psychrodurans]
MVPGKLRLDYTDKDYEEHWVGNVTSWIVEDLEVVLEFSCRDSDLEGILGQRSTKKYGALYIGRGPFKVRGSKVNASLSLTQSSGDSSLSYSGTWQNDGGATCYDLNIELDGS